MANTKLNGTRHAYASIDTAPGVGGYWCDSVSMSAKNATQLVFSRSGEGVGIVALQYQLPHAGATWIDYDSPISLVDGVRAVVDDMSAGVKWRAGIKEDNSANPGRYESGTIIVGFEFAVNELPLI